MVLLKEFKPALLALGLLIGSKLILALWRRLPLLGDTLCRLICQPPKKDRQP